MKKFTNGCVRLVERYLPDPFIFCIILTIVVFIAALFATGASALTLVQDAWAKKVWDLLAFSMQMALVLVLGNAFATAPIINKALYKIAGLAKTPAQAILEITFISTLACWANWGFGLVVGALLAKEIARQVKGVDYRLLMAAAYSGFVVWHAGFSGSIPLQMNTANAGEGMFQVGTYTAELVDISRTIFAPWNLIICAVILFGLPLVLSKIHPSPEDTISVDPALLTEDVIELKKPETPAEKLEYSRILSGIIVIAGLVYLVLFFAKGGAKNISLNVVNFIFLILGILAHGTPIAYVKAVEKAAKGAAGIILQFPFYAGIQGLMTFALAVDAGGTGQSLAGVISSAFVAISNQVTFPLFTFLSAGIVNFFVPSGGGQWTVQGPIMMPAGLELGVDPALTGMAIAWGDAWTNMIQPFWALPALGIAGLSARDIMGYCVITLIFTGIVVCGGFVIVGLVL